MPCWPGDSTGGLQLGSKPEKLKEWVHSKALSVHKLVSMRGRHMLPSKHTCQNGPPSARQGGYTLLGKTVRK